MPTSDGLLQQELQQDPSIVSVRSISTGKTKYIVKEIRAADVLFGRGSGPNDHVGNIQFRQYVAERKAQYMSTNHRLTKTTIAREIVETLVIRQDRGRFLKKVEGLQELRDLGLPTDSITSGTGGSDYYELVDDETIMEKAKQALRQNNNNNVSGSFSSSAVTSSSISSNNTTKTSNKISTSSLSSSSNIPVTLDSFKSASTTSAASVNFVSDRSISVFSTVSNSNNSSSVRRSNDEYEYDDEYDDLSPLPVSSSINASNSIIKTTKANNLSILVGSGLDHSNIPFVNLHNDPTTNVYDLEPLPLPPNLPASSNVQQQRESSSSSISLNQWDNLLAQQQLQQQPQQSPPMNNMQQQYEYYKLQQQQELLHQQEQSLIRQKMLLEQHKQQLQAAAMSNQHIHNNNQNNDEGNDIFIQSLPVQQQQQQQPQQQEYYSNYPLSMSARIAQLQRQQQQQGDVQQGYNNSMAQLPNEEGGGSLSYNSNVRYLNPRNSITISEIQQIPSIEPIDLINEANNLSMSLHHIERDHIDRKSQLRTSGATDSIIDTNNLSMSLHHIERDPNDRKSQNRTSETIGPINEESNNMSMSLQHIERDQFERKSKLYSKNNYVDSNYNPQQELDEVVGSFQSMKAPSTEGSVTMSGTNINMTAEQILALQQQNSIMIQNNQSKMYASSETMGTIEPLGSVADMSAMMGSSTFSFFREGGTSTGHMQDSGTTGTTISTTAATSGSQKDKQQHVPPGTVQQPKDTSQLMSSQPSMGSKSSKTPSSSGVESMESANSFHLSDMTFFADSVTQLNSVNNNSSNVTSGFSSGALNSRRTTKSSSTSFTNTNNSTTQLLLNEMERHMEHDESDLNLFHPDDHNNGSNDNNTSRSRIEDVGTLPRTIGVMLEHTTDDDDTTSGVATDDAMNTLSTTGTEFPSSKDVE